jgi:hypothetical protein
MTDWSWPRKVAVSLALATSQTRAVLSPDAVTMRVPSGLKRAEFKEPLWPCRTVCRASPHPRCGHVAVCCNNARPVGVEGG